MGPFRMTSAPIAHLKAKDNAVIIHDNSVLGFVPMAVTAFHSATKAAIHSYALSQRFLLKDSKVQVLEIAPSWVRTDLMNNRDAKAVMSLDQFIAETMSALESDANEILVEGQKRAATMTARTNVPSSTLSTPTP
jgi:uncharacterized oxidoreductase